MDVMLSDLPQVYVKGRNGSELAYEIKTVGGDILMAGRCNHTACGGWPEERFSLKQANSGLSLELKGEAVGCCSCGGNTLLTEVNTSSGNSIGFLKGIPSDIKLYTTSNDVLGRIYDAGFFSSNKKIKLIGAEGDMKHETSFNTNKYLITFPDRCTGNSKVLIVAAALEMLWKATEDRNND